MMSKTTNPLRFDKINAIVREFVKASNGAIQPDDDLEQLGLTSLDMVNLMLAVEAEFDLTIPGAKLLPKYFRSVRNIDGLVSDLLH
jgi:acyl carrier protein